MSPINKMPYKQGKMKGELTSAEIRRLISAHNKLSKITIPKGTKRDGLLKLVETNGFRVDHKNEKLIQTRSKALMKIDLPPKKTKVKKLSSAEAKKLLGGDLPKENYGGQSTQAKKSKEQILKSKVNTNSIEKNKEMVNKDNIDFNELMKKISLPLQYLKQTAPRKEAMTQVSTLLLDKNISYDNFVDIIDNLELYHEQFSLIGGFSFKKGEAPPKWRMPLSKMVRDVFNSNDKKKDWKAWTDRLPKKGVKLAPSSNEVDEKILKLLEDGKKLLETFLKENKGFEKKDYKNLKNKKSYQESLKNFNNFVKGYNSIISAIRKKSTTPEIEKKVNEYKEKSVKIRNTIEAIYKYRKTPNKMGELTLSF